MCDLLTVMDAKIIQVALNGLENILRSGNKDGVNPYAVLVEECYGNKKYKYFFLLFILCLIYIHIVIGLDKIEFLQSHANMEIYQKAFDIIEQYFGGEEEDAKIAPSIDPQQNQFQFAADTWESDALDF